MFSVSLKVYSLLSQMRNQFKAAHSETHFSDSRRRDGIRKQPPFFRQVSRFCSAKHGLVDPLEIDG
jgi:hypothetical protein